MQPTVEELKELSGYLLQKESNGLLTSEQEKSLIRQYREGNLDALGELLEGNIRFVVSVAKNYLDKGLEMADLVGAGTRGLVEAADNYNEAQGFRFLSYAIWYIRESILEAIKAK